MRVIIVMVLLACLNGCRTSGPDPAPLHLALVQIVSDPFRLRWNGKTVPTVGTNWRGFVVTEITPKSKQITRFGKEFTVDVSVLTLKRGERTIRLVKGKAVEYNEHIVHLLDLADRTEYSVRSGEEVVIGSRSFLLRGVDTREMNCTLRDVGSGEQFTIKRVAQPEN
jgi:hypothetical protein